MDGRIVEAKASLESAREILAEVAGGGDKLLHRMARVQVLQAELVVSLLREIAILKGELN